MDIMSFAMRFPERRPEHANLRDKVIQSILKESISFQIHVLIMFAKTVQNIKELGMAKETMTAWNQVFNL